jgi:hypothetical protein
MIGDSLSEPNEPYTLTPQEAINALEYLSVQNRRRLYNIGANTTINLAANADVQRAAHLTSTTKNT